MKNDRLNKIPALYLVPLVYGVQALREQDLAMTIKGEEALEELNDAFWDLLAVLEQRTEREVMALAASQHRGDLEDAATYADLFSLSTDEYFQGPGARLTAALDDADEPRS